MKQYTDLYLAHRDTVCRHSPDFMNSQRDDALRTLLDGGIATRKHERYRYTDMHALFAPDYGINLQRIATPPKADGTLRCGAPESATNSTVIVGDMPHMTTIACRQAGTTGLVAIDSFRHAATAMPHVVEQYYNTLAGNGAPGEVALNTLLAQDGLLVYAPQGSRTDQPLHVTTMLRSAVDMMVLRRMLIVVEQGAHLQLVVSNHATGQRQHLASCVIEAFVGRGATLDICCIDQTNSRCHQVTNTYVMQQRDSRLNHTAIALWGATTRNTLDITLAEEGAGCCANGIAIADQQQHTDCNTLIHHAAPNCTSRQEYRYVARDKATAAFAGRILVAAGAAGTQSEMNSRNLCASSHAHIYTQPMLEIYADDVQCSHGCTVGQLADAQLFYMQQRGIPRRQAQHLLESSFLNDTIQGIPMPSITPHIQHLVDQKLKGENNSCHSCNLCR